MWDSKSKDNNIKPERQPFSERVDIGNGRVPNFVDNVIKENIRSLNKARWILDQSSHVGYLILLISGQKIM